MFQLVRPTLASHKSPSKQTAERAAEIRAGLKTITDTELRTRFQQLAELCHTARPRDGIEKWIVQAVAVGAEAIQRTHGFDLFGVQLMGAIAAASGNVIDMQTGEGKTVVTGVAALAQTLLGESVHVATTNDYLAKRDFESLRPAYDLLGISAGLLPAKTAKSDSRRAYDCQITYGPGYQFGFDFLFDQISKRSLQTNRLGRSVFFSINGFEVEKEMVQCRGFAAIMVDEADSVLVDEAMTPLIVSFESDRAEDPHVYRMAQNVAAQLEPNLDYIVDGSRLLTRLTPAGEDKIDSHRRSMKLSLARPWRTYVEAALHAEQLLIRDEHYVVTDRKVKIVDPFTGRIFDDRSWQAGLHQAVEAKEDVPINPPRVSKARITRQRLVGLYQHVCGLSGTALGAAKDFKQFYRANVVPIPTHRPCRRVIFPARFFADWAAKLDAIAAEVVRRHATGQPVLIGTRTIRESKRVFEKIASLGLAPILLNGVQDQAEAEIVAGAGQLGTITIATNMAGRGTDITLSDASRQAGGLHVIGTEPNDSARVDRQLIGRAARQGDTGSAQFFISAEDGLLAKHAPGLARQIASGANSNGESTYDFSRDITALQSRRDKAQFLRRQEMVRQDNWMDTIRDSVFGEADR